MKSRLDIRSGPLVPWHFRFVGLVLVVIGLALLISKLLLALVLLIVGLAIITSYEGTEIDSGKKLYRDYISFFFVIKTGKFEKYNTIERVFITKSKESQQMYTAHTMQSATFKNEIYSAYLKFGDGAKVQLLSQKNKETLIKKLKPLTEQLNIEIVDYTLGD